MCGQSQRLYAEDCLRSIWFAKVLWDQAVCCCALPGMQCVGGQLGNTILVKLELWESVII